MKWLVAIAAIILAASILLSSPAAAFEKSRYPEGLYYSDLEIAPGVSEPLSTGGVSGKIRYVDSYLLSGTIENAKGRERSNIQVRFRAADCSGTNPYWFVPLGPYEPLCSRNFMVC